MTRSVNTTRKNIQVLVRPADTTVALEIVEVDGWTLKIKQTLEQVNLPEISAAQLLEGLKSALSEVTAARVAKVKKPAHEEAFDDFGDVGQAIGR